MNQAPARRRFLQQKEAFHNAIVSVPCFISAVPTKIVAVSREPRQFEHSNFQDKLYFNGRRFLKTRIFSFNSIEEAKHFFNSFQSQIVKPSGGKQWAEYCKDLTKFQGVLYQEGRIFVPWLENKQMRQFVSDVGQLVVFHGLFMEQHLQRTPSPLFRFLDRKVLSLEYIYYRWRVYAYLQNDGDKRYRTEGFRIIESGLEWIPPMPATIQRGVLNHKQRKYFSHLVGKLSRKKQDIEEAMVFAISYLHCAVEVVSIIAIEILERPSDDLLMPYFLLVSDILFNTTTPDYRRLFSRILPFAILHLGKSSTTENKEKDEKKTRLRSELKSLIQLWEIKFIFDQNYTKGLLFLLGSDTSTSNRHIKGLHERLKAIGDIDDQEESQFELQKLCFTNGIPFLQNNKQESTKLINEYLWIYAKTEERVPQINQNYDGEPISEKDLFKIKNKQVKVVTSQGLPISILLEKNWQTKAKATSNSIDLE